MASDFDKLLQQSIAPKIEIEPGELGRAALLQYFVDSKRTLPEKSVLDRWLAALDVEATLQVLDSTLYDRSGEGVFKVWKCWQTEYAGPPMKHWDEHLCGFVLLSPRMSATRRDISSLIRYFCYDTIFIGFHIQVRLNCRCAGQENTGVPVIEHWSFGVEIHAHQSQTPHPYSLYFPLRNVGQMFGGNHPGEYDYATYDKWRGSTPVHKCNPWGYPTPSSCPFDIPKVQGELHEGLLYCVRKLQKDYERSYSV